jgi:ubiquinone/menaquinone biosynthesis C-methylase UbiE
MYPHYEVSTLDFSNHWEDACKEAGIKFRMCDLERQPLPFEDDYFDLVIFNEVLEHLFAPQSRVLREVRRVIRTGGKIILSVPNIAAMRYRVVLLLGMSPLKDLDTAIGPPHDHVHEYTMSETASKLEACGFAISQKKYLQPSVTNALRQFRGEIVLDC